MVAARALRPARKVGRSEQHAGGARRGARHAAEEVDEPLLVPGVVDLRVERLVGAVREHHEIGRLVADLLGEVVLVPAQRGEDLRPVDAERVDHDAGLRAVERHAEDADLAVADRADLDLVGRVGDVEREEARAGLRRARAPRGRRARRR